MSPFDIIATDAGCRTRESARMFREVIRPFVLQGRLVEKPVAITEFGCATFRDAFESADGDPADSHRSRTRREAWALESDDELRAWCAMAKPAPRKRRLIA